MTPSVRERYSDERPGELTGYAENCTDAGDPVLYGGGKTDRAGCVER